MSDSPQDISKFERIWLHAEVAGSWFDWTWCQDKIDDADVEYVRADKLAAANERIETQRQIILSMEEEFAILPEDVSLAEYVGVLKERIEELEKRRNELADKAYLKEWAGKEIAELLDKEKAENQRLREALERIDKEPHACREIAHAALQKESE